MSRASRASRVASAALYGGGGLVGLGATTAGVLFAELKLARRSIGDAVGDPHDPTGTYRASGIDESAAPIGLVLIGDSTAAGFGVDHPDETPAAVIARGLSARVGAPVWTTTVAEVGARSSGLDAQLDRVLGGTGDRPQVAVVMIGANDVTHGVRPAVSVRHLAVAVARLRASGIEVVVGTCPDLGTVRPIRHPLRLVARRWARSLAAAQTIAVVAEGGRSVSLGDLLGPEFEQRAHEMFGPDRFHPSAIGYAAAASALLPAVCSALGLPEAEDAPAAPTESLPIAEAAARASDEPGTEVVGTTDEGPNWRARGAGGLRAVLRRIPGTSTATERVGGSA